MEPIPYRIRIGVTGHRLLDHEDDLRLKVREVLDTWIIRLFDEESQQLLEKVRMTPLTYSVMTALAEGADRLVAETILAHDPRSSLEVVLPMTLSDYRVTFRDPENPDFDRLTARARNITKLRRHNLEMDPDLAAGPAGSRKKLSLEQARKEAFKTAGHHIVNHCDVLVAIWDGKESKGIGGTHEIIEYALAKQRPVIIIPSTPPHPVRVMEGFGLNCRAISEIEQFNKVRLAPETIRGYVHNMYNKLFPAEVSDCLPDRSREMVRNILLPYYVKVSFWAKKYQRRVKPSGVMIFSCSALAVASVVTGVLYHPVMLASFLVEFICLLSILLIYLFAQQYRKKWLEYRFLAERLRTASYFVTTDTEIQAIVIPPYMGEAHHHDDWMIRLFNEVWSQTPRMEGMKDGQFDCFKNYILSNWVEDQKEHHQSKHGRLSRFNRRFGYFGWVIYLLALIISAIHIVDNVAAGITFHHLFESVLIFLAIALPAIGAAVVGIHKQGEYERLEHRSGNMSRAIENISIDFQQAGSKEELVALMREFDRLLLLENLDWLMLMKLVKLEVHP